VPTGGRYRSSKIVNPKPGKNHDYGYRKGEHGVSPGKREEKSQRKENEGKNGPLERRDNKNGKDKITKPIAERSSGAN